MATKVVLTVVLPGAQMVSTQAEKENWKESTDLMVVRVGSTKFNKETKKKEYVQQALNIFPRKSIPATQTIKISQEAWAYMQSLDGCPSNVRTNVWKGMSKKDRLETHFKNQMWDLGGKSFTYEVLED